MIDVYTLYDNFGLYSSYFGLVPDYNVVFAILAADTESNADLNAHADIVGEVIIEALIEIALSNAESTFSGTYTASELNSSISSAWRMAQVCLNKRKGESPANKIIEHAAKEEDLFQYQRYRWL